MSLGLGFCIYHRDHELGSAACLRNAMKTGTKQTQGTSQAAILNAMLYINTLGYPVGFLGAGSEPEVLVPSAGDGTSSPGLSFSVVPRETSGLTTGVLMTAAP